MEIFTRSYLVRGELPHEATHPDEAICELYKILAEDKDGYRWTLNTFSSFSQEKATNLEKKIKDHLETGGKLDLNNWREEEPCYGSKAYCETYGW
jgi:hypothetical protein